MAVAHHGGDALQACQLLRGALRKTAGHHDSCRGVQPVRAANEGQRGPVGLGRHATGVHHHHIGRGGLPLAKPGGAQLVADRLAVGARGPAAEVLHMKTGPHDFSL